MAVQQSGEVYAFPGTFETRATAIEGKVPSSITGNDADVNRESPEMVCAGEVFEDFQSLTRRFAFVEHIAGLADPTCIFRNAVEYIRPPAVNSYRGTLTVGEAKQNIAYFKLPYNPSPLSFVAAMYAFYRGSLRVKVFTPQDTQLIGCQLGYRPWTKYALSGLPRSNYMTPNHFEQSETKKFGEFQIPYYSPTLITVPYPEETAGKLYTQSQVVMTIGFSSQQEVKSRDVYIGVAAGDDMTFHMFLGVPPVLDSGLFAKTWTPSAPPKAPAVPLIDLGDSPNPCFSTEHVSLNVTNELQIDTLLNIQAIKFTDLYTPCKHVSN